MNIMNLPGELVDIQPLGNGLINKLIKLLIHMKIKKSNMYCKRLIIIFFPNVRGLMENIEKVTSYLRKNMKQKDVTLLVKRYVIRTKEGHLTANLDNGSYWRIYDSVENSYSLDKVENPQQFYITAKAFGRFAYDLNDFDAKPVGRSNSTIPRYSKSLSPIRRSNREDRVGRVKEVQAEIDFIQSRKADCFFTI